MTEIQVIFTEIFTVIPDSKSKIKSSSYLESGKYAVVDQGKELIAGYTDTSPTVVEKLLPVIVFGDHTRAVKYVDFPFTAGADGTQILKPSSLTNPKYGFYLVLHAVGQIPSKGYARHFGELKKMKFHLPSLEKQQEIVEKLDSVFAEIELLERNLGVGEEKANRLLESILSSTFKQSTAFSEQNESSAEENLPIKLIKLVDLCKLVGGGTPSKANAEYYSGNIPWATVRDMRSRWLEDTEHKINEIAVRESSTNVIPSGNVVLASRVGLGKVIQLKHDTAINQDLRALIPKENSKINSDYLYYWTLSITPEIISAGKGATVQGVTLPFLENLVVPLLSLENQSEVVEKLDSAFAEIELLKAQIRLEKDNAVALRQSLLSNAFTQEEEVA